MKRSLAKWLCSAAGLVLLLRTTVATAQGPFFLPPLEQPLWNERQLDTMRRRAEAGDNLARYCLATTHELMPVAELSDGGLPQPLRDLEGGKALLEAAVAAGFWRARVIRGSLELKTMQTWRPDAPEVAQMAIWMDPLELVDDPLARVELAKFRGFSQQRTAEAITMLEAISAESGSARCAVESALAQLRFVGDPTGAASVPHLEAAARRGDPYSMVALGSRGLFPEPAPNPREGYRWTARAAMYLGGETTRCNLAWDFAKGVLAVAGMTNAEAALYYATLAGDFCSPQPAPQVPEPRRAEVIAAAHARAKEFKAPPVEILPLMLNCSCAAGQCVDVNETHCTE